MPTNNLAHAPPRHLQPRHPCRRQASKAKFGNAYQLLQQALPAARARPEIAAVRPLLMAADWIHFKLLLYAIGSGSVTADNMKQLRAQWLAHVRSFGAPFGAPQACQPSVSSL